jgi:multidrug efflux pump subunit AcrB
MSIIQIALQRPYTFIVMSLLIAILGFTTIKQTPTDIFPNIDIPVVTVIWSYNGMSAQELSQRVTTICERAMTTTVNDIEHIESQSLFGMTLIKVFFHPNAKVAGGIAQITSIMQTLLKPLPPGITPPFIIQYNASSVPVLQLALESQTLTEQQLYDYGLQFVRTRMATVQGASIPLPYGGKVKLMNVDLDPQRLLAKGLTPGDVIGALNAQNLILPAGTAKMGEQELNIRLNASADAIAHLNQFPIKQVNGAMIYIGDVATVHEGFAPQTNIVNVNGRRSALLTVLKNGNASTLDVVNRVKARLPEIQAVLPALDIKPLFDQSLFVRAAIDGVLREGLIAACLTAAMILLFLGSWRATLIVAISIPLAILSSIILLGAMGETLNVMTLGGLALAVGILVDDATVEVENIHRNVEEGRPLIQAIIHGWHQIAAPTFISTCSICIVFVSVNFLNGPARYLFTPLALAVVFAMAASYMLSRTLVPVLARLLLPRDLAEHEEIRRGERRGSVAEKVSRLHERFNVHFENLRTRYVSWLAWGIANRRRVLTIFGLFVLWSMSLLPLIGRDFFPTVDAGIFRLHVRAPAGTRVETTNHLFHKVVAAIREIIPADDIDLTLSNVGLPGNGVGLAFSDSATIGSNEGEILCSLRHSRVPTAEYMRRMREQLPKKFPNLTFFFQPADIVNQILNFGLPAPIDIQVTGPDKGNYEIARRIAATIRGIPGVVDAHVHEVMNVPNIDLRVDRSRAEAIGLTQANVAGNLLLSLTGSGQGQPNWWLDPKNGVQYLVAVQTPQYRIHSVADLLQTAVLGASPGQSQQMLSNLATVRRGTSIENVDHYDAQPVFNVYANVQGRDLGAVDDDIQSALAPLRKTLPKGTTIHTRGQVESMNQSFFRLQLGIGFAVILVYLLMVVNFQSWLDPFVIITALPGAFCGVVWMLFLTQTTFSVPSLMGTIMCIGVATANSILLVTFANERRKEGDSSIQAALAAGYTRLRPVLMTAAAMIIGMLPMALGLGEGGEQNAPLGRAVIGGLLVATITTLMFVPVVYSYMRRNSAPTRDDPTMFADPDIPQR